MRFGKSREVLVFDSNEQNNFILEREYTSKNLSLASQFKEYSVKIE